MKTAIILGSTGLTGQELLKQLLDDNNYIRIIVLNRSKKAPDHPKLTEIVTDFKAPVDLSLFEKIDTVFSCLGTTRKNTPDLEAYREIEIGIPFKTATEALKKGLNSFHFISSIGANSNSSNFYQKIKGEAENSLQSLKIPRLYIYQPGMLRGDRKEFRLLEKLAVPFVLFADLFLRGRAAKYHSVHVKELAQSMIRNDKKVKESGTQYVFYSNFIGH